MLLALSAEAAPGLALDALAESAARRGIGALHLVFEDAAALAAALRYDVVLAGISVRNKSGLTAETAAAASLRLGAPFVVRSITLEWGRVFAAAGASLVAGCELNAAKENVAEAFQRHAAADPRHITLRGGGPEGAYREGRGIGSLMAQLAVRGFQGTLVLAPSDVSALPVWRTWLNQGRSWGCGSKQSDPSLVQLG